MILESKEKIDKLLPYLPLRLARALTYIRDTDFSKLPDGKHAIEGEDIFIMLSSYKTGKKEDTLPEAHFKYIDIQCLLEGEELVYYTPLAEQGQKVEEKDVKADFITFANTLANETEMCFKAGQILIFFPWDIHRTKCKLGTRGSKVRKAVLKVRAES